MNSKKIILAIVVALAAAGAIFLVLPKNNVTDTSTNSADSIEAEDPSDGGSGEQAGLPTYTMDQVKKHNNKDDCWTVISGGVYDLTKFIPNHPGGDEIERACGEDATTFFTQREDEDGEAIGTGTPHSGSAQAQLAELKIGELAN